jgi:ABC-2 type transport system ATP-binding protein
MNMIECKNLTKCYGKVKALDHVNLALESGRIVGLAGPNGSGKTTLIKLIEHLLVPSSGEILVQGMAPGKESKRIVSYLPDRDFLPEDMKLETLLDMYGDFYTDFNRSKAQDMLENLDIQGKRPLKKMSKGTREKVQLILTMSREAKIYLLDEPIAGVDPATRDYILSTIVSNYSEDALVLISTHLIADVEKVLDEVIFLKEGRVFLHRNADDLRTEQQMSIDGYFREVFKC